ncbi:hypothetical protein [Nonomuraea sp. 10N515B]|uniref:hypothetical protein n=1 Tax=Nonomuraea sp. 10N515B TaxID=3457422 RepID=UPI003FCD9E37
MIRRKLIGLVVAATVLSGAGVYGAASAFAATPTPAPTPSATPTLPPGDNHEGMDRDSMIRHCTEHLPADQRDEARQQMEDMMSGSMMGGMHRHGTGMMG